MTSLARGQNQPLPGTPLTITITGVSPGTVDLFALQVTDSERVRSDSDLVFFNSPSSPEGAVTLTGPASITIDPSRVPHGVTKVRLAVALDDKVPGTLASVGGLGANVGGFDCPASGLSSERAAVLAEVYQRNGAWKVRNVSAGWDGGLVALLTEHGVTVDTPPAATPPPASYPPPATAQPAQGYPPPPTAQPAAYPPPPAAGGYQQDSFPPPAQPSAYPPPAPSAYPPPPTQPGFQQPPAAQGAYPPPPAAPSGAPVNLGKVTLTKQAPTISLAKSADRPTGSMRVNLNWTQGKKGLFGGGGNAVDLDLACFYELRNGERGGVQALGNDFGSLQHPPYIQLDADDRSGQSVGGENLHINLAHLEDFSRILIFAYIYEGTPNWAAANGVVTLYPPGGPEVEVRLDNPDRRAISCAIAQLHVVNGELSVTREVRYIHGSQRAVAEAYNWGLKFTPGRK